MPTTRSRKYRRNLALLLLAAAAAVGGVAFGTTRHAVAATSNVAAAAPSVVSCERDGMRYEFHVPTGGERLTDPANDPNGLVNLVRDRPDVAAACRRDLAKRLGVSDISELRAEYADTVRRLHTLGYF